jgi:hypothetical protein
MDDFGKLMENEATPRKNDFVELVDFIMANPNNQTAIEGELAFFVDKLVSEHYLRGYEDAAEVTEKVMRKKIREGVLEVRYKARLTQVYRSWSPFACFRISWGCSFRP